MIFLEISARNKTYLINSEEICSIEFDKCSHQLTIRLHNSESIAFIGNDLEAQYTKLLMLMKKTFMIVPVEMVEDTAQEYNGTGLPNIAKNLPELDACTLITEKEEQEC